MTATSRTPAAPSRTGPSAPGPSAPGPSATGSGVARAGVGRRWTAGLVTTLLPLTLWWALGAPWLWVVAAVTGGLLARVAGRRTAGRVLPKRLHLPAATAAVAAMAALAVTESAWVWLLLVAATVAEVVLLRGNAAGRGRIRTLLAAAGVMAIIGTTGLVVEHVKADQRRAAAWAQTSELNRAQLLPRTPARAAGMLLAAVADADPTVCTVLLAPAAAGQLAAAAGAADCPAAERVLAGQVVDPRRYPTPDSDAIPVLMSADGQTARADLCGLTWDGPGAVLHGTTPPEPAAGEPPVPKPGPQPGPQLGRLYLTRVLGQGYRIDRITPC